MSYYITDTPAAGRGRRRLLVTIAAGLIVLVGLALLVWPTGGGTRRGGVGAGRARPDAGRWSASSRCRRRRAPGPPAPTDGVAAGFTHDELGAVLAAVNIAARLNVDVGPTVYEAVARQQCVGDIDTALAQLRTTRSQAPPAATVATAYFYRVDGGDPDHGPGPGDHRRRHPAGPRRRRLRRGDPNPALDRRGLAHAGPEHPGPAHHLGRHLPPAGSSPCVTPWT